MGRRNLIEAKSKISQEHIRMAVAQLLDYAFRIEKKFGKPNMAALLPAEETPPKLSRLAPAIEDQPYLGREGSVPR